MPSRPLYASRTVTNLLLAVLAVAVAAGFAGRRAVVSAVLLGVPLGMAVVAAASFVTAPVRGGDEG